MKWIFLTLLAIFVLIAISSVREPIILDIRTQQEYERAHIPGAILVETPRPPLSRQEMTTLQKKLEHQVGHLSKKTPIVVYCAKGRRAGIAMRILKHWGYTDVTSLGGINSYTGKLVTTPREIEEELRSFFTANPNPTDQQVHAFAKEKNINKHVLEEHIYAILTRCMQNLPPQKNAIDAQLRRFFIENPNPSDKQVHALAKDKNINKHVLEEHIYAMLTRCLS